MPSPVAQAIATVRRRPMLAVAGAGVLGVIAWASSRGPSDAELAQQSAQAAGAGAGVGGVGVQGYALPGTYAPGDLATADLANAIREGNALQVNAIAQLGNALQPNPALQREALTGAVQPILDNLKRLTDRLPTSGAGPAKPPATPVSSPSPSTRVVRTPGGNVYTVFTVTNGGITGPTEIRPPAGGAQWVVAAQPLPGGGTGWRIIGGGFAGKTFISGRSGPFSVA